MKQPIALTIQKLVEARATFSARDVVIACGVSRQAVNKHLAPLVESGVLAVDGKARAAKYRVTTPVEPIPLRRTARVQVASAGSLFRLSARLLLDGIESGDVVLDFTGVAEVSEEFLDEIFLCWAPKHPRAYLRLEHVPSKLAPQLFALARKALRPSATPGFGRAAFAT